MSDERPENELSEAERESALAAEHALGLLVAEERAAAERREREDGRFAAEVERWHHRLAGWLQDVPAEAPPERVWSNIEQAVAPAAVRELRREGVLGQLWVWRTATAGALALAAALSVVVWTSRPEPEPAPVTPQLAERRGAVLASNEGQPAFIATLESDGRVLITALEPVALDPDHSLELWLVPQAGAPLSLGLVETARTTVLVVPPEMHQTARTAPALALSLEPAGGSPGEAASGPLVYQGPLSKS
jgi:anti-sigma-K factor RskA